MDEQGFSKMAADMNNLRRTNDWLHQEITAGRLYMNPKAAENAAKSYEEAADQVTLLIRKAMGLQHVSGLGDYISGQQLAKKFALKAKNDHQTGAADLLAQCRDELNRKAELHRLAAKDYVSRDDQIAQDLQRGKE